MTLYQTTPGGKPQFVYPAAGWVMNQRDPAELQIHPMWPLCYGVDGRATGSLKRFRGFRRLDFDIREHNSSGLTSWTQGPGGDGGLLVTRYNSDGITPYVRSFQDTVIDFKGASLERPGQPPVVGFIVHGLKSANDEPGVVFRARGLGDSTTEALSHSVLYQGPSDYLDGGLNRQLKVAAASDPLGIDRIGVASIGRLLLLSHKYAGIEPEFSDHSSIHAFSYLGPSWDAAAPIVMGVRVAGARGFSRSDLSLGATAAPAPDWFIGNTDGADDDDSGIILLAANSTTDSRHNGGSKMKVRVRYVNRTTGFVGPMSPALEVSLLAEPGESIAKMRKLHWAVVAANGNVTTAHPHGFLLLRTLVGGSIPGEDDYLPDTTQWDVRLQVFCTLSTTVDSPQFGQGVYYLDHEVSLTIDDPNAAGGQYTVAPAQHASADGFPTLSNDELAFQEVYDPEFDQPGELSGGPALGEVDGMVLSLDTGTQGFEGATDQDVDISRWDIRASPPWKFEPTAWLEAIAWRTFHRVEPTSLRVPGFLKVGSVALFVSQNKVVRIRRNGTMLLARDGPTGLGPVNREAAESAGSSVFIVTQSDVVEMNATTMATAAVALVHRIIAEKWRSYARDGRIICGFDPQTRAVYIAPRIDVDSIIATPDEFSADNWQRSECIVLWLDTGRVTMLHDVYWVAMSRSVHPITGKEHLFMIDPAGNITYPDDSTADDDGQVSTMTGINKFEHPNLDLDRATGTIQVLGAGGLSGATIRVKNPNGEEFLLVEPTDWLDTAPVGDIAESIKDAINAVDLDATATRTGDTVTITSGFIGPQGNLLEFTNVDEVANLTFTGRSGPTGSSPRTYLTGGVPADAGHDGEAWGGTTRGAITALSGTTVVRVQDSAALTAGKGSFDQYTMVIELADPAATNYTTRRRWFGALRGSQVYFFRRIADPDDSTVTRTVVIADARIRNNGQKFVDDSDPPASDTYGWFDLNSSEINYRDDPDGSPYSLAVGDEYSIAPVVFQVIGAPLDVGVTPHSNLFQKMNTGVLGFVIGDKSGFAASGATQYPSDGTQGDMFIGVTVPSEIESMTLGAPLVPGAEKSMPLDTSTEESKRSRLNLPREGFSLMPVITNYGTGSNFELRAVHGEVDITPEGDSVAVFP